MEMLSSFQKTGYLCDMDIVSKDGALFGVHSCVVAATSSVLEAAITLWISKPGSGPGFNRLAIETSIPDSVLPSLISSMYTGHINVEEEHLDEIRSALTKLGVKNASKRSQSSVNTSTKFASCLAKENSNANSNAYFVVPNGSQLQNDDDDDDDIEDETSSRDTETDDETTEATKVDNSLPTSEQDEVLESIKLEPELCYSNSPSHFLRSRSKGRTAPASGSTRDRQELLAEQLTDRTLLHHRDTHDIADKDAITSFEIKDEIIEETESPLNVYNTDMLEDANEHFLFSPGKSSTLTSQKQTQKSKSQGIKGKADMQSKKFKCVTCQKMFRDKHGLTRHVKTVHLKLRPYHCQYCVKTFKEKSELNRHYAKARCRPFIPEEVMDTKEDSNVDVNQIMEETESPGLVFSPGKSPTGSTSQKQTQKSKSQKLSRCVTCQKVFRDKHDLTRHVETVHQKLRPYYCNDCEKTFKEKSALNRHYDKAHCQPVLPEEVTNTKEDSNVDMNKSLKVTKKDLNVDIKKSLLERKVLQLSAEDEFLCRLCGETLQRFVLFERHLLKRHGNIRPYACNACSKTYRAKASFRDHVATHKQGFNYYCDQCAKAFSFGSTFWKHRHTVHTKVKPFKCSKCDKSFHLRDQLKVHDKSKHQQIRNYLCSYCSKSFSTRSCLNIHEKIHTGLGRIQCPKCTKTFIQMGTFRIHMRYHTGDRPYPCRFCPSAYTSSNMRKQHERKQHENNNVKLNVKLS